MAANAASKIVIIVGAGPGLGASLAHTFANHGHPVAVAARSLSSLQTLAKNVNDSLPSGKTELVKPFSVDASDSESVKKLVESAAGAWGPSASLSVGVWNPNAGFGMRPFMEWTEEQVEMAVRVQVLGAFTFSQSLVKQFLKNESTESSPTRGTLLFTGATAGQKGSANFAGFAAAKGGARLMAQSMAKELGKEMIHVAQAVVDGLIDTEHVAGMMGAPKSPFERLHPDAIAAEFYHLTQQHPSVWSHEIDLRPAPEKW